MVRILSKYRFNYSFLLWFILLTLTFLFISIFNSFAAIQVPLEWVQNSEPDFTGYKIFCTETSLSYDYANPSLEGTDSYCTIYDLNENNTYCFVARAFDTEGFENENSKEVCNELLDIPNQPPTSDAGPDQTVYEGRTVLLNGSNSTEFYDGIAPYRWVQIGKTVGIINKQSFFILFRTN